jgi:hypothetical protein
MLVALRAMRKIDSYKGWERGGMAVEFGLVKSAF